MKPILAILKDFGIWTAAFIVAFIVYLGIMVVRGSWFEPAAAPPGGNVAAPITLETPYQGKVAAGVFTGIVGTSGNFSGSIRANDFKVLSLNEWMNSLGGGLGCNWTGWRCECGAEISGSLEARVIFGIQCTAKTITDFKIVNLIVSGGTNCPASNPYPPAQCAIYNRNNFVAAPTNLNLSIQGPLTAPWIYLAWTGNSSNEDGFRIESPSDGGMYATLSANTDFWNSASSIFVHSTSNTPPNFTLTFRVRAFLDNGIQSSPTNTCTVIYNWPYIDPTVNIVSSGC